MAKLDPESDSDVFAYDSRYTEGTDELDSVV